MSKEVNEILNLTELPEILMTVTHQELLEILLPAMQKKQRSVENLKDRMIRHRFKSLFEVNVPEFITDKTENSKVLKIQPARPGQGSKKSFLEHLKWFSLSISNPHEQPNNLYFSFHDLFQMIVSFHHIEYDKTMLEQPASGLKQYAKDLFRQKKNDLLKATKTKDAPWQTHYYKDNLIKILCNLEEAYKLCYTPVATELKECLDPDKLGLLIVSKMFPWLNETTGLEEKNMAYLNYINSYYDHLMKQMKKDPTKKNIKVLSVTRNGTYDVPRFLEEYYQYCEKTILHEEQQDTLFVDWEFLTSGKKIKQSDQVQRTTGHSNTNKKITLNEVVDRKLFYKQYEPVCAIRGKDKMKGYYGHVYPNGKIVFEKYYCNEEKGILASREATYVMDILYFEELSKWTKSDLLIYMAKTPSNNVTRIRHDKNWKEKLQKEISCPIKKGQEYQIANKLKQIQFDMQKTAQVANMKQRTLEKNRSKAYQKTYNPISTNI